MPKAQESEEQPEETAAELKSGSHISCGCGCGCIPPAKKKE